MPSNGYKCPHSSEQDPILKILGKYKDHPSIKLIQAKNRSNVFKFRQIDIEEVKKLSKVLTRKKPHKCRLFSKYICDDSSDSIRSSKFPNELKQ